jgi:hypothetical protein
MILIDLSKKDKLWRSIAFNICKDKSLADELTQQMYLKVYETSLKRDIETNDYYIAKILERELLLLNETLSYREIQRKYNINYQFVRRVILNAKSKYGKR